jgi:hypothetical protein
MHLVSSPSQDLVRVRLQTSSTVHIQIKITTKKGTTSDKSLFYQLQEKEEDDKLNKN